MSKKFSFAVDHMIGRREVELTVAYSVIAGSPEQGPTYACGGTPADPDEVEIISIHHDGVEISLSNAEEEALLEMAIARSSDDMADEAAAYADYRYQERRDQQMVERWERGL